MYTIVPILFIEDTMPFFKEVHFHAQFLLSLREKNNLQKQIEHASLLRSQNYISSHSAFLLTVRRLSLSCMHFIVLTGFTFRPKTGIVGIRPHFSHKNMFLLQVRSRYYRPSLVLFLQSIGQTFLTFPHCIDILQDFQDSLTLEIRIHNSLRIFLPLSFYLMTVCHLSLFFLK